MTDYNRWQDSIYNAFPAQALCWVCTVAGYESGKLEAHIKAEEQADSRGYHECVDVIYLNNERLGLVSDLEAMRHLQDYVLALTPEYFRIIEKYPGIEFENNPLPGLWHYVAQEDELSNGFHVKIGMIKCLDEDHNLIAVATDYGLGRYTNWVHIYVLVDGEWVLASDPWNGDLLFDQGYFWHEFRYFLRDLERKQEEQVI
jgi:hypothetical protein